MAYKGFWDSGRGGLGCLGYILSRQVLRRLNRKECGGSFAKSLLESPLLWQLNHIPA